MQKGIPMNKHYIYGVVETLASSLNHGLDHRPWTYPDGIGYATPVSMKAALRNLVEKKDGPLWQSLAAELGLDPECYQIAERNARGFAGDESPQEKYRKFFRLSGAEKRDRYVDLRWFGGTHLTEEEKAKGKDKAEVKDKLNPRSEEHTSELQSQR